VISCGLAGDPNREELKTKQPNRR